MADRGKAITFMQEGFADFLIHCNGSEHLSKTERSKKAAKLAEIDTNKTHCATILHTFH